MFSSFKLLDTVSLQNNISANWAISVSADNGYCIIVEDGLYILHLCGLMDNISSSVSLKKLFIILPDYAPSADLGVDLNSFLSDLSQNELYETILNLDLSEKVRDSTYIKQQPVQAKWSPLGLICNNHCAIACMTNRGSVYIFVRTVNEIESEEYINIANITEMYIAHVKPSWIGVIANPTLQLDELKARSHEVLPTAFEWSNLIKMGDIQFCFLFVGHLNGELSVWRIDKRMMNQVDNSGIKLITTYKTDLKRITALTWQKLSDKGLLLVGDLEGKVKAICITTMTEESILFGKDVYLWNESDYIQVENFKILIKNGMTYIFIIKGGFLLISLINETGDILDLYNFHAGNLQISGLEHVEDNTLLILTHTGIIKEINVMLEENKLRIDWRYLYVDFPWHLYRTHGLIVSSNKVFIGVLLSMAKIDDIRRKKAHIKLLIFKNMTKEPLNILMKNSSESLTLYWDCLEILRLNGVIERKLPCDGLPPRLNYDKLSIIQLKTCLWLAKSSEALYDKMYLLEEYSLLRSDELKYILRIKLACKHLHFLFEKIVDSLELDEFHMQSLDVINMSLKEIVVDDVIPSLGLGKNTIAELYDAISAANELQYPAPPKCVLCGEDIIGTSCIPPHLDTRCSISLMQVVSLPYYKCPFCASVVHWKLTDIYSNIMCPYCDVAMNIVSIIGDTTSHDEKILSTCNVDCEFENIDSTDIEDHAFMSIEKRGGHVNLLAVSSSEEEEEEDSVHEDSSSDITSLTQVIPKVKNIKSE